MCRHRRPWHIRLPRPLVKPDMTEFLHGFADMLSIGSQPAALLPGSIHFRGDVAEDMEITALDFDVVLEVGLEFVHADLRDIRPHAQRVGKVADLDWIHRDLPHFPRYPRAGFGALMLIKSWWQAQPMGRGFHRESASRRSREVD